MTLWCGSGLSSTTFRNLPFHITVAQLLSDAALDDSTAQASYDRRLCLKVLIERIPDTHTYPLT